MVRDIKKRMGSFKDFDEISTHKWLKDINWDLLYQKKMETPFIPTISGDSYLDYFDEECTKEGNSIN